MRPATIVAAIGSILAGFVHAAAARNHDGDAVLWWMFVLCALAQVAWGVAVSIRGNRGVLLLGIVINSGAVLVWGLSRTVGIPIISALAEPEDVGRQDLGGAAFAALSVVATVCLLVRPSAPRVISRGWVGMLATVALVSSLPVLTATHVHDHLHGAGHHDEHAAGAHVHGDELDAAGHGHADAGDHAHDGTEGGSTHSHSGLHDENGAHDASATHEHGAAGVLAAHEHGASHGSGAHEHSGDADTPHSHPTDPSDPHTHPTDPTDPHTHPTDPTNPDDPHTHPTDPTDPEAPITSLDDPRLTQAQFDAAIALIVSTTDAMRGFVTEADLLAGGYQPLGDGGTPGTYSHYLNWAYLTDDVELDPTRIESIVMKMNADGTSRVVSGMYILSLGDTMDDVPDIAGSLTTWHDHDDLCFDGTHLVGTAVNGACASGVLIVSPPMLHVWVETNPCGPFAGVDQHGVQCDAPHQH